MLKNKIKKVIIKTLKLNLNLFDLEELLYWQLNFFTNPVPIFIKKWVLNRETLPNTNWFEVAPETTNITYFLSKISQRTYAFNNVVIQNDFKKHPNLLSVNSPTLLGKIQESCKAGYKTNLFIHSNSTPFGKKKYNYHIIKSKEKDEVIFTEELIIEVFSKLNLENSLTNYKNLTVLIDDFNEVKGNKNFDKYFRFIYTNSSINWSVQSNILIINLN
tara:strand:- start:140 stop:790 length:651 start_codon:yes stop_codon:yes gene_type:complete